MLIYFSITQKQKQKSDTCIKHQKMKKKKGQVNLEEK